MSLDDGDGLAFVIQSEAVNYIGDCCEDLGYRKRNRKTWGVRADNDHVSVFSRRSWTVDGLQQNCPYLHV